MQRHPLVEQRIGFGNDCDRAGFLGRQLNAEEVRVRADGVEPLKDVPDQPGLEVPTRLLIEIREQLRNEKLWSLSDLIRDRLAELGVVLEDLKEGSTWRWK